MSLVRVQYRPFEVEKFFASRLFLFLFAFVRVTCRDEAKGTATQSQQQGRRSGAREFNRGRKRRVLTKRRQRCSLALLAQSSADARRKLRRPRPLIPQTLFNLSKLLPPSRRAPPFKRLFPRKRGSGLRAFVRLGGGVAPSKSSFSGIPAYFPNSTRSTNVVAQRICRTQKE